MIRVPTLPVMAALFAVSVFPANADPRDSILAEYASAAGVSAFDPAAGEAFFRGQHTGGNPDTASCTACHTDNLRSSGRTRAGKTIDPMAVSANPNRFTDAAKVEKWFRRNCNTVLGRECTAKEKGDVIAYLSSL